MTKQSDTVAKFTEAKKYGPNWGRLHLKWGEALGYTGVKDEARAQYQKASTLDLSFADKAELARQMRGNSRISAWPTMSALGQKRQFA